MHSSADIAQRSNLCNHQKKQNKTEKQLSRPFLTSDPIDQNLMENFNH